MDERNEIAIRDLLSKGLMQGQKINVWNWHDVMSCCVNVELITSYHCNSDENRRIRVEKKMAVNCEVIFTFFYRRRTAISSPSVSIKLANQWNIICSIFHYCQ